MNKVFRNTLVMNNIYNFVLAADGVVLAAEGHRGFFALPYRTCRLNPIPSRIRGWFKLFQNKTIFPMLRMKEGNRIEKVKQS